MRTLTDRQREILDFIRSHLRDHRVAPTRPEIAAAVGVKTTLDHQGLACCSNHLTSCRRSGAQGTSVDGKTVGLRDLIEEEG